jgi:hypothetical protein
MAGKPPVPKTESDLRVMLWFFSWLAGMSLCSAGFVLMVFASPGVARFVEQSPWVIPACAAAGLSCFGLALAPWYFGIRCRRCRRKLRRLAAGCDLATGYTPLRFHCETCDVVWETHLVSGPGNDHSTPPQSSGGG